MWAQYANNNQGVCLIFDKDKLDEILKKSKIGFYGHNVIYKAYYQPFKLTEEQLNEMTKGINTNPSDFVRNIVTSDSDYIIYNYFTKLDDWSSENEYRYISYSENTSDTEIEISKISPSLCGVVIGEKMGEVEKHMLKLLLADGFNNLPLKQIIFEDLTTRIKAISYTN